MVSESELLKKLRLERRRLKSLNKYQAEAGALKKVPEHSEEELRMIVRANEFGTMTIPARSFLRGAAARNKRHAWRYAASVSVGKVINGGLTAMGAYKSISEVMAEGVRHQISIVGPANAPATIKKKGRNEPLVDTGGLRRSIDGRVTTRG